MKENQVLGGRYQLIRQVFAVGGMGEVWQGRDQTLDRNVAIKIIRREISDNPDALARFRREALIGAGLNDPGLTVTYDLFKDDRERRWVLVMEFLEGDDLRKLVDDGPGVGRVLAVSMKIIEALAAAHAAGVIHRDVKPGNIMELPDGRVKICDFGIAKARDSTNGLTGAFIGTFAYSAPERIERMEREAADAQDGLPTVVEDARADLYSFGIVLHELLRGRPPFVGEAAAVINSQLNKSPRSLIALGLAVPQDLDDLILELLRKNPDERPADALDVLDRIRGISQSLVDGRYELVEVIGRSSHSTLYRAHDFGLTRRKGVPKQVAIRIPRSDLSTGPGSHQERVVTEFDGPTLREMWLTPPGRPVPVEQAVEFVIRLLAALEESHGNGVVHPGLSPDNMVLTGDGVQFLHAVRPSVGFAPDVQADLHHTGRVLYELLTGRPPFPQADSEGIRSPLPRPPSELERLVPSWCDPVVLKALETAPARSYQSAAEFREAITRTTDSHSDIRTMNAPRGTSLDLPTIGLCLAAFVVAVCLGILVVIL